MEADQTLYISYGITNVETQSTIRRLAFIITLFFGAFFIYLEYKKSVKTFDNVLDNTLESIFLTLFETTPKENPETIFRVNLYKFYENGTIKWKYQRLIRYWEFKKTRGRKDRRLQKGSNYLLCFKRYGYKYGNRISNLTTYPFKVDRNVYRLFTGKVYENTTLTTIVEDNYDINAIVEKIPRPDGNLRQTYIALLNESPQRNYNDLFTFTINPANCLTPTEQTRLEAFMKATNTLALDLFDINNGVHCNHFMGFKVIRRSSRSGDDVWGVVTIDALQPNGRSFYEFIGVDYAIVSNRQWLEKILKAYSKLLSDAISKL